MSRRAHSWQTHFTSSRQNVNSGSSAALFGGFPARLARDSPTLNHVHFGTRSRQPDRGEPLSSCVAQPLRTFEYRNVAVVAAKSVAEGGQLPKSHRRVLSAL